MSRRDLGKWLLAPVVFVVAYGFLSLRAAQQWDLPVLVESLMMGALVIVVVKMMDLLGLPVFGADDPKA